MRTIDTPNACTTLDLLIRACEKQEICVSADLRVGESDAATLLGYANPGSLKNIRIMGSGPPYYRRPVAGSRVSYRLIDLARWLDDAKEEY